MQGPTMGETFKIRAVTVNHNTSHFTELMVRSLFNTNDLRGVNLRLTVLDNSSNDDHVESLTSYLAQKDIPLVQTGFDVGIAPEKHGAALTNFVREHDDCTHYLFLDSDMWFTERNTVPTLRTELAAAPPSVFANQARIYGYYARRVIEGRDGVPGANALTDGPPWDWMFDDMHYATLAASRCSPVCCLISNSPIFRTVVDTIGLGRGIRFGVGRASYYDTFALMTHVMATHGLRFIVSSKTVNHFTETTYRPELREIKDQDCMRLLKQLQAAD